MLKVERETDDRDVEHIVDPRLPTKEEVDAHNMFHSPYRNWCPVCVKARGKEMDHRKSLQEPRGLSEHSLDYCFPGDEFGHKLVVRGGRERVTWMTMGTAVPTKGASGKFASDRAVNFMQEPGDISSRVVIKTDRGPAITYFVEDIIDTRPEGQTSPEESPVKSSGSNCIVERSVQGLEGQLRAMLLAFEGLIGRKLDAREPVILFMPRMSLTVGKLGPTEKRHTTGAKGRRINALGWSSARRSCLRRRPRATWKS